MSKKKQLNLAIQYLKDRFSEASTWRGLILVFAALGMNIEPAHTEAFIFAGLLAAGAIGAAIPDKKQKKKDDNVE